MEDVTNQIIYKTQLWAAPRAQSDKPEVQYPKTLRSDLFV